MTTFVLNTGAEAVCNGTVTAWNYCYNTSNGGNRAETYEFTLAMYRPRPDLMGWHIVSESLRTISVIGSLVQRNIGLACAQFILDEGDQFEAQAGDVIAACVQDRGGSQNALPIFSQRDKKQKRRQQPSFLQTYLLGDSDCTIDPFISSVDLGAPDYNFILHLSAEIGMYVCT